MLTVALVNPPGIKTLGGLQMHVPGLPLGLAYLAAAAREAGHRVAAIDGTGEALDVVRSFPSRPDILIQGLGPDEIAARVPSNADVVGVTCMFSTAWPITRRVIEALRRRAPAALIVCGGEHVTAVPDHVLRTAPVDVCVLGEGEDTFVDLLDATVGGRDLSQVPGLAMLREGALLLTPSRARRRDIDAFPLPAWDLFPVDAYLSHAQYHGTFRGRSMPLLSSRGCPFECTFCTSPQMWTQRWVVRQPALVCDEIDLYMRRYGATNFDFQDLTAIVSKRWIIEFCRELLRRDRQITWQLPVGTRSEAIDGEVTPLLYESGCRNLAFAPESGSADVRAATKKKVRMDHVLAAIRAAVRDRLSVCCFFVIGFPQDTPDTLGDTLALARRLAWMGVDDITASKFLPYPGSELFEQLRAQGEIELGDDFYLSICDFYQHGARERSWCPAISPRSLYVWQRWLLLNFYIVMALRRPLRLLRVVFKALFHGVEETRYAKWLREVLWRRRRWQRLARDTFPLVPAAEPALPRAQRSLPVPPVQLNGHRGTRSVRPEEAAGRQGVRRSSP